MADSNAEGTAARERLQAIRRVIARLPASDEIDGGAVERVSEEHTVRQILDDPEAGAPVEALCMEQVHMTVWSTDGRCHTVGCVAAVIATTYPGLSRDEMQREEREARRRGDAPNWTEAIGRVVGLDAESAEDLFHGRNAPKRLLALTPEEVAAAIGRLLDGAPPARIWRGA